MQLGGLRQPKWVLPSFGDQRSEARCRQGCPLAGWARPSFLFPESGGCPQSSAGRRTPPDAAVGPAACVSLFLSVWVTSTVGLIGAHPSPCDHILTHHIYSDLVPRSGHAVLCCAGVGTATRSNIVWKTQRNPEQRLCSAPSCFTLKLLLAFSSISVSVASHLGTVMAISSGLQATSSVLPERSKRRQQCH